MYTYYIYKHTNFISKFNTTDYQSYYYVNISAVIGFSIFQDSSIFYTQIYHAKVTKLINVFLYIRQLENFPIILIQPFKIVTDFVSKFIATNYQNYPTPFSTLFGRSIFYPIR